LNEADARRQALRVVKAELFDPTKTVVRDEVINAREVGLDSGRQSKRTS
jgi:hypothetical protein